LSFGKPLFVIRMIRVPATGTRIARSAEMPAPHASTQECRRA